MTAEYEPAERRIRIFEYIANRTEENDYAITP